jgi:fructuronate reductase
MNVLTNDRGIKPPIRIVHLGLGAFFRAFGLAYLERLNASIEAQEDRYGVMGVSFRSPRVRDALAAQGFTYTALERGGQGDIARTITSLCDVAFSLQEQSRILAQMADVAVSIVSLTVTEKGYCQRDGALDLSHPDIVHDIANPQNPISAPAYIVAALALRRTAGIAPFSCLSCDNLFDNGRLLARVVSQLAEQIDPTLAAWIAAEVCFPVTMIDRIVPATSDADRANVLKITGHKDDAPVTHEPFSQWVIEDNFGPLGRPDFASVGVQMVDQVAPYESMKLRCLNGSHTALAILGSLRGKSTVRAAISDAVLSRYITSLWEVEICPSVDVPIGVDISAYCDDLRNRYSNPAIVHLTAQIASDTSKKLPPRILATLADNLAAKRPIGRLCLVIAGWMRFIQAAQIAGEAVHDPLEGQFRQIIKTAATPDDYVTAMLGLESVFPVDLALQTDVVTQVKSWYVLIAADGIEVCLQRVTKEA